MNMLNNTIDETNTDFVSAKNIAQKMRSQAMTIKKCYRRPKKN